MSTFSSSLPSLFEADESRSAASVKPGAGEGGWQLFSYSNSTVRSWMSQIQSDTVLWSFLVTWKATERNRVTRVRTKATNAAQIWVKIPAEAFSKIGKEGVPAIHFNRYKDNLSVGLDFKHFFSTVHVTTLPARISDHIWKNLRKSSLRKVWKLCPNYLNKPAPFHISRHQQEKTGMYLYKVFWSCDILCNRCGINNNNIWRSGFTSNS